ncbi:MAG: hypothetical protein II167_05455, partial [Clostridiales bacterium]|nr:hypothetical protein [Clostridiales bacterium]
VTIAGKWADRGADTKIDYSVTLDDLTHLDEYDLIVLYMHGNYNNYWFRGKVPMMKTVQEVNEETNKAFSAALASHSVATGSGCYAVTPDFFTEQYGSDGSRLDGKFFFLASCRQMGANGELCEQWSDALIKAGASAVVAFQNDADKYYATQMANIYGQLLLDGNAAGEAFESAVEQTVNFFAQTGIANSPYFVPLFRGDSNAKLVQGVSAEATAEPIPTATESTTTSTPTPTSDITPTPTPTPEVVTAEASTVTVDEYGHVIFGRYEQDGDLSNGPEPIVWELLSQEDGSLLLISRDIIDAQPFNTDYTEVTWEDCSLRRWLNNDFLNEAFSEAEQGLILTTVCEPDSTFGGERGSATEDKVFCLSAEEVFDYYEMIGLYEYNMNGYCLRLLRQVTQYAIDRGVWHHAITEDDYYSDQCSLYSFYATDVIGMDGGMWWLRTPGNFDDNACRVTAFGAAGYYEYTYVDDISVGVRPVIRLDSGSVPADANLNRDDVVGMWRVEFGEGEQTTLIIYATGDIHGWHTPSDTSGIDYEIWGTWDLDGDRIVIDWEDGTHFESEYSADGNTLVLEAEGDTVYMRID